MYNIERHEMSVLQLKFKLDYFIINKKWKTKIKKAYK